MTGIIDIVFLLIIFFLLVCQFIVAENFEVTVPDNISSAKSSETATEQTTTVTVMFTNAGKAAYAVGSEKIIPPANNDISGAIADAIDGQLQSLPPGRRVVCLRVDKNICYLDSQYALAGISQSTATDIKLSVLKEKQPR